MADPRQAGRVGPVRSAHRGERGGGLPPGVEAGSEGDGQAGEGAPDIFQVEARRPLPPLAGHPLRGTGRKDGLPARPGDLPEVDFDYPATATLFSFRDNNLFLVGMESSRLRVVISAQRNRKSGSYDGQIFVDMGGNQLMHYNGPVHCTVD